MGLGGREGEREGRTLGVRERGAAFILFCFIIIGRLHVMSVSSKILFTSNIPPPFLPSLFSLLETRSMESVKTRKQKGEEEEEERKEGFKTRHRGAQRFGRGERKVESEGRKGRCSGYYQRALVSGRPWCHDPPSPKD